VKTFVRLATAFAVVAATFIGTPASAQESGCGYGSGGDYASTICWIDMSGFDQTTAMSTAGQPMTIELNADYSMSFTFKFTAGADGYRVLKPTAFPTYSKAPIGNTAYTGTPGKPALYQQVDAGTGASGDLGTLTIEDLTVTGPSGQAVDGYGIVMADAESTNRSEGLTFASDEPIEELTRATMPDALPACGQELSGLGTTSVTCKGNTAGGLAVEEIVLYADSPTTASIGFLDRTANAVQGVAFGVLTAKVGLSKTVVDKTTDTDSFGLSIEDDADNLIGEGSTEGGDAGSIPATTVLAGLDGRDYTFTETAEGDTDLSTYTEDWSCTNNGQADDALPSGNGTTKTVAVKVGDDIRCTITNTGAPVVDPTTSAAATPVDNPTSSNALPETGGNATTYALLAAAALAAATAGWLILRRSRTAKEW